MKKILFILVILFLLFALVGCAEVTYSVSILDGGERIYDYKVTLDQNNPDTSTNILLVKSFFEYQKTNNQYADVIYDEKTPNVVIYRIHYESQTEYNEAMGITGDEPNDDPMEYTEEGLFRNYEGLLLEVDKADFASYALMYLRFVDNNLSFKLRECLKTYIMNPTISDGAKESVIRVCNSDDDTVDALDLELSISHFADELADITYESLKILGYDYSKVIANFEYSHIYKSIKGVDPDNTKTVETELGKMKVYSWNLDFFGKNEIMVSQKTPNVWLWEVIAIGFGILVAVIVLIVFLAKRKKLEKSMSSYNKNVFEQNGRTNDIKEKQNKFNFSNNNHNVNSDSNSQYASWFGHSGKPLNNESNNNAPINTNNEDDDVFDGYFNEKTEKDSDSGNNENNED